MFELQEILNITSKRKVKLCSGCDGDGEVSDDSWGSGASDMITCGICNATGRTRVIECQAIVEVPYDYKIGKY